MQLGAVTGFIWTSNHNEDIFHGTKDASASFRDEHDVANPGGGPELPPQSDQSPGRHGLIAITPEAAAEGRSQARALFVR